MGIAQAMSQSYTSSHATKSSSDDSQGKGSKGRKNSGHLRPWNHPPTAAEPFWPNFAIVDTKRILWLQQDSQESKTNATSLGSHSRVHDRLRGSVPQKAKVSLFPLHHPWWRGRAGGAQLVAAVPPSAFSPAVFAGLSTASSGSC